LITTNANSNYFEKIEVRGLFLFGQISTNLIKRTELSTCIQRMVVRFRCFSQ